MAQSATTSSANMTATPPSLRQRLESLPQELYDHIYNLTFTAASGERKLGNEWNAHMIRFGTGFVLDRTIRFRGHDSINLFLVDRASSRKFAMSYYGGEDAVFTFRSEKTFDRWALRLSADHRDMVRDCRIVSKHGADRRCIGLPEVYKRRLLSTIRTGTAEEVFGDLEEYEGQDLHNMPFIGLVLPPLQLPTGLIPGQKSQTRR